RQAGKALHTDTPIATPNGWSTMGNLRVGDRVFDEAGTPCSVTSCSEVQDRPVFRVRFSDGSEIVADCEPLWTTLDAQARAAISRDGQGIPDDWSSWQAPGRPSAQSVPNGVSVCRYPDCGCKVLARGLCTGHYQQQKAGKPLRTLRHPRPHALTLTTLEMLCSLSFCARGDANHAIPAARALKLRSAELPIDP